MLATFIDLFLHLDVHLSVLAAQMGPWLYVLLFCVIFAETGLIVTPFLPGDSLLFATGALIALEGSGLDFKIMWMLLVAAAFIGDNINYQIGAWIGPKIFNRPRSPFLNPDHLRKTHAFYEKNGGRTVFLARFLPIFRTFVPFIAGVGRMNRREFVLYSMTGSVAWMTIFLGAGHAFGNIPWVKKNFAALIMAVIVITLMPIAYATLKSRWDALQGAKRL